MNTIINQVTNGFKLFCSILKLEIGASWQNYHLRVAKTARSTFQSLLSFIQTNLESSITTNQTVLLVQGFNFFSLI